MHTESTSPAQSVTVSATPAEQGTTTQTGGTATETTLATTQPTPGDTTQYPSTATNTVVALLSGDGRYTTLVKALGAADLATTLNGSGPFTIFAPTNDAFSSLPAGSVDDLFADPGGELTGILKYHVVRGTYSASELSGVKSLTTLQGEKLSVEVVNGTVMIDEIRVIVPANAAANGVIYGIEGVLIPSSI